MAKVAGNNDSLLERMEKDKKKKDRVETVKKMLEEVKPEIERLLPINIKANRMVELYFREFIKKPSLFECSDQSIISTLYLISQHGLEPGPLGYFALVPKVLINEQPVRKEIEFRIMYQGILKLMRRSREYLVISAHEVYENDYFEHQKGFETKLTHIPDENNPGKLKGFYAYYMLKDGGKDYRYWSVERVIDHAKKYSPDYVESNQDFHPSSLWKTDFIAMGIKTMLKQLAKYAPMSVEDQRLISMDEKVIDESVAFFAQEKERSEEDED